MVSYGKVEPITTAPRPYTRLVNALKTNHSNLAPLARVLNQPTDDGLAAVIKFYDNGAVEERFLGSSHLDDFLHTPKDCARQLFLLQGVPPNYVEILGFKFNIDPNFFARHIHSGMPVQSYLGMRDIPLLASHPTSRESFCMRYHELRAFADPISDWELRAIDQPRRVSVSKFNGDFDGIGIARKNASVWFRETEDGKGWNGIPPSMHNAYCSSANWQTQQSFWSILRSATNFTLAERRNNAPSEVFFIAGDMSTLLRPETTLTSLTLLALDREEKMPSKT